MHIFWESGDTPGSRLESPITNLSWMCLTDDSQGLLGAGSESGSVGITRTNSRPHFDANPPTKRLNFNLRGHHSPIQFVAWNKPQSKLATCDQTGTIYVWVPYEERWSVELVNDRGIKVRDFCWSPSGSSALICYEDNFVLIGSATGQRMWSNIYVDNINCGAWSPSADQLILGCSMGKLRYINEQGTDLGEYDLRSGEAIQKVLWSAERAADGKSTILVCFADGVLRFMDSVDDPDPVTHHTHMTVIHLEWTVDGELLMVTGYNDLSADISGQYENTLLVYSRKGTLLLRALVPIKTKAMTAACWGHDDECIIVGCADEVAVARTITTVPTLQFFTSYKIWSILEQLSVLHHGDGGRNGNESKDASLDTLPIPTISKNMITTHNYHIIQCHIPTPDQLLQAVCKGSITRWFCTIQPDQQRHHGGNNGSNGTGNSSSSTAGCYSLCMEHMGGLVPILRGRQTNKLLPEFEIRLERWKGRDDVEEEKERLLQQQATILNVLRHHHNNNNNNHLTSMTAGGKTVISKKMNNHNNNNHKRATISGAGTQTGGGTSKSRSRSATPVEYDLDGLELDDQLGDGSNFRRGNRGNATVTVAACTSSSSSASNTGPSRDSMWRRSKRKIQDIVHRAQAVTASGNGFGNGGMGGQSGTGKKEERLVQVTSNVWCTRFKILGMSPSLLPPYLGQVVYKTSVLHLQPRQMTVHVVNMENKAAVSTPVPPPPPTSHYQDMLNDMESGVDENLLNNNDEGPPIAPMDSEIFMGLPGLAAIGGAGGFGDGGDDGGLENENDRAEGELLEEEEIFLLNLVLNEFSELRDAVDRHIARMRDFAEDLQRSSQQLNHSANPRNHSHHLMIKGTGAADVPSTSSGGIPPHSAPSGTTSVTGGPGAGAMGPGGNDLSRFLALSEQFMRQAKMTTTATSTNNNNNNSNSSYSSSSSSSTAAAKRNTNNSSHSHSNNHYQAACTSSGGSTAGSHLLHKTTSIGGGGGAGGAGSRLPGDNGYSNSFIRTSSTSAAATTATSIGGSVSNNRPTASSSFLDSFTSSCRKKKSAPSTSNQQQRDTNSESISLSPAFTPKKQQQLQQEQQQTIVVSSSNSTPTTKSKRNLIDGLFAASSSSAKGENSAHYSPRTSTPLITTAGTSKAEPTTTKTTTTPKNIPSSSSDGATTKRNVRETWETFEFIDDDETLHVTCDEEKRRLRARALSFSGKSGCSSPLPPPPATCNSERTRRTPNPFGLRTKSEQSSNHRTTAKTPKPPSNTTTPALAQSSNNNSRHNNSSNNSSRLAHFAPSTPFSFKRVLRSSSSNNSNKNKNNNNHNHNNNSSTSNNSRNANPLSTNPPNSINTTTPNSINNNNNNHNNNSNSTSSSLIVVGGENKQQLKEITSVLDKLYKLANELKPRTTNQHHYQVTDGSASGGSAAGSSSMVNNHTNDANGSSNQPHPGPPSRTNSNNSNPSGASAGAAAGTSSAAAAGGGSTALLPPHPQSGGKVAPHRSGTTMMQMDHYSIRPGGAAQYNTLRSRLRDIAQRVGQLEQRINAGNELLDDVRSDLQSRVHRIRTVLDDKVPDSAGGPSDSAGGSGGDSSTNALPIIEDNPSTTTTAINPSSAINSNKSFGKKGKHQNHHQQQTGDHKNSNNNNNNGQPRVMVLQNKAPFWNEQSQVYQLDFGGRVTQESAKNFQIEYEDTQVMQFGRIENGAYTLDFQSPFSAAQAFAVALASITQRLK